MSDLQTATNYLMKKDPVLAPIIKNSELPAFKPHKNYYWELVDSIISQQLSVKAAASIEKRFQELFNEEFPSPELIIKKQTKNCGLSALAVQKLNILKTWLNTSLTEN